jgi:hypothetical protein
LFLAVNSSFYKLKFMSNNRENDADLALRQESTAQNFEQLAAANTMAESQRIRPQY